MAVAVRLYNEKIDLYERVHYSHGEEREEVNEILTWFNKKDARILDLGCGTGLHALRFAEMGHRVIGLDKSEPAIGLAKEYAKGREGLRFEVADIEQEPLYKYEIQDLVVSIGNTISHLPRHSLVALFDRVRRCLAPGGIFTFNTIYWASPFLKNVIERGPDGEIYVTWERTLKEDKGTVLLKGHFVKESYTQAIEVQCYKIPEIVTMLESAGFGAVKWSNRLDFKGKTFQGANTIYYRGVNGR
jgi:SAM-dependent methyltransferase